MKTNKKNKEIDINEVALTVYVDSEVIGKVRSGEINQICLDINDDNYRLILENVEGHLLLVIDEMPETFHGCYLYNKGVFPYAIKSTLDFLLLKGEDDYCLSRIIGINTEPGVRFRFQGPGKPSVEDADGDSCIWEVQFEIIPVPAESRHYLMRWNPSISSFTEKDYEECVANMEHGMFRINWSIYDWEEARRGDFFYMMRVGDDKAGIVFSGQFLNDPYPGDDWGGSTKRRMYVDMVCMNPAEPQAGSNISLEKLQKAIPSFEWSRGHSGVLLSNNVTEELEKLM
ncbi:hypothetical protein [Prevotella sp. tf2-5]|uniref:hypothetical protein n=1 Tax=Prevotella sp. tf2-5 TaxID=1761889 RepID=UPI0008EC9D8D|nr:hypothetical protein [Prevotella sp. tf2-5]SFO73959.1 hypothetical protein SAMN04487852_106107 [Prevotella sp. tf2-5]